MQLKECYDSFGGSYELVNGRIHNDDLLGKLVCKFPADPSYEVLLRSMNNSDYASAFRAAHTLKGICLNLSFVRLGDKVTELTNALRKDTDELIDKEQCDVLLQQVITEYQAVVTSISEYSK